MTWPPQDPEILVALKSAWADGSWGRYDGPHNERLVGLLQAMHGVAFVLPCSSGTIAVELALRGLQLAPDDEVILPGYDFSGNFRAIEAVGARPVLVDIDRTTWCLDANRVAEALSPRTRVVIVSHLHGGLADMKSLDALRSQKGFAVLEDVCQVPGARVQGRMAGTWGDVAVMSFGGSKLLTAGRGGALLTNREDIFQRAKIFAERGNNAFPLSELQAAVLPPQLRQLDVNNQIRRARVEQLLRLLPDVQCLRPVRNTIEDSLPVFYKLAFEYMPPVGTDWTRQRFIAALQAASVPVDEGFRGFTRRGSRRCRSAGALTNSGIASQSTILLHHPILLEDESTIANLGSAMQRVAGSISDEMR